MLDKNKNNKRHTVLITGATGDLGYEFVRGFANLGYNILFTSRSESKSKKLIDFATKHGSQKSHSIIINLDDDKAADKIINKIKKLNLYPDILLNNARNKDNLLSNNEGIIKRSKWISEFKINVLVPYELSSKLSILKKSSLKKIINISSIYGVVAPNIKIYKNPKRDSAINYGTVKAALNHLTKELSVRLADKKIQVNSVSYGGVKGNQTKLFQKKYSNLSPQNKMIPKNELFGVIDFLISDKSANINGHNIIVDGGWTVW